MFHDVNRRLFRSLIYVLVAGQLLLSAPMVSAMSAGQSAASSERPCADSMHHARDSHPCPCCPDQGKGDAACLSACTASVAATSSLQLPAVSTTHLPPPDDVAVHTARASDPPLDPPPIA